MFIYLLLILLIIYVILYKNKTFHGFNNYRTFVNENIYDEFYTKLYDEMFDMIPLYKEQINEMIPYFGTTNNFLALDSRTGHINQLLSQNMNVTGLDKSYDMIKLSKEKYPKLNYIQGNYNPSLFKNNLFTHIFAPLFCINTITDFDNFFICMDKWLVHKGYLFVTLYNDSNKSNDSTILNHIINHKYSSYFEENFQYEVELDDKLTVKIINNKIRTRTNIQYLTNITENDLVDYSMKIIKNIKMQFCSICVLQKN